MTCSIGVVNGETSVDLSQSVGLGLSITLSVIVTMADTGDDSDVMWMTCSIGVVNGETSGDLSNGPRFSLTFSKMMNTNTMESRVDYSSVSNGSNSRHETITVVNTSDETTMGVSRGHLANGVWVTADSCSKCKNQRK